MDGIVLETALKGPKLHARGKVRDIYDLGDSLLMVSTDRISAFDYILPEGIPLKGRVLNGLSAYWFERMEGIIGNHVITSYASEFPDALDHYRGMLDGRSMIVKKTKPIPVECVARGYLAGSGWAEYRKSGEVCGIRLPKGLRESDRLPEPIFTPATKEASGHDINVSEERAKELVGGEVVERLKECTLEIYRRACRHVEPKGIIISDTKFEFGFLGDEIILIDEVLTPDSSRFWPKDSYLPGGPQKSFDKQYVRDYLEGIRWNKEPPVPHLPKDVVGETSRKYVEAYERITGKKLG